MIDIQALIKFLLLFLLIILGFSLEILFLKIYYILTKKSYKQIHYSFGKYVYYLTLPVLVALYFIQGHELNFVAIFIGFALLGTLAEWLVGFFYHKILGQRLWTYHRYTISGYTSLLSTPLWGLAGIVFYFLIQIFK